jgi:hypothetical protein
MIEELVKGMSELDNKRSDDHIPEDTFARSRYIIGYPKAISRNKWMGILKKTYVYH